MAKQARRLQDHEVSRLLAVSSGRDKALIWCCLGAGLRAAEAADLRCGDIGADGSMMVRDGKGDEPRLVYLTPQAHETVRQHWATLEDKSPDAPLFPSRKHQQGNASMLATSAVSLIQHLMGRAGIDNASSHSLRRTHAQALEEGGHSVRIIQRQLGHKWVSTTQRYLALNPPGHRDAVRGLEFKLTP